MKLLIDMNLSPKWAAMLNGAGFSARHWSDVGSGTDSDRHIMAWAATNDHVVLTHDLDFGTILNATKGHKPSVVQLRSGDVSPRAVGAIVIAALRQVEAELQTGALLTIDASRTRLRMLPLFGRSAD